MTKSPRYAMASKSVMCRASIILLVALLVGSAAAQDLQTILPSDLGQLKPETAASPARSAFGDRQMPYFILCMIMFAFSFVAFRMRDRIMPLMIVSLIACSLLIGTMFWHDGSELEGRRTLFFELTSPIGEALILQEQFLRPGMIRGRVLQLPDGVHALDSANLMVEPRRDRPITVTGNVLTPVRTAIVVRDENLIQIKVEPANMHLENAWFVDEAGLLWQGKDRQRNSDVLNFIPAGRDPKGLLAPVFTSASKPLRKLLEETASEPYQRNRLWAVVPEPDRFMIPLHSDINWLESNMILTSKLATYQIDE